MPGVMEGWPKVVVEAWIAGTVPICANAGLLPHLIQPGENGFLFEADPASMAVVCKKVIPLSTEVRQAIIENGKKLAKQLSSDSFKEGIQDLCKQHFAMN
jgi:glycosyltransferase involved in cell wall biosynthesis